MRQSPHQRRCSFIWERTPISSRYICDFKAFDSWLTFTLVHFERLAMLLGAPATGAARDPERERKATRAAVVLTEKCMLLMVSPFVQI